VQAGGFVHIWGAFHIRAKSPLVPLERNANGLMYKDILPDTVVPFVRQHFWDNFRYQCDNATHHHARIFTDYILQEDITKMDKPARSPDCNPIEHLWDELARAINNIDYPLKNLNELCQALLVEWAESPAEFLQHLVTSMPHTLAAIIRANGGNTLLTVPSYM
jgi:hypothetical protein